MSAELSQYRAETANLDADGLIRWALQKFGTPSVVLASSLSVEDQALTHLILTADPKARVFVLDTGRHFQETYDTLDRTMNQYGFRYEVYFPEAADVEDLVKTKGANGFYESIENRKLCCEIRKIRPLRRALSTAKLWITGLRRDQSVTRTAVEALEWDAGFGLYKLNPLYNWSEQQTWDFCRQHNIPVNRLQKQGFLSIGCQPCTRAVKEGEDIRAGRWWWENPETKECGLHR